jgi:hypothetical protein
VFHGFVRRSASDYDALHAIHEWASVKCPASGALGANRHLVDR